MTQYTDMKAMMKFMLEMALITLMRVMGLTMLHLEVEMM
jgi:hypothetical protein